MRTFLSIILIGFSFISFGQTEHSHNADRAINFPDVPGFLTLKADLHIHTVFSDGEVWPSIRVQEATRDNLDIISMTEHLEYQPHKDDIPHPDRNRSHEVALNAAKNSELVVVRGSEITRSMPPGHANAIFIEDANKLLQEDFKKVFKEANDQGAFVFWNHPNWTSQRKDGIATLTDDHARLIKKGYLHGIEVVNETTYSEEALQIALENELTIIGTSDVHGLIDWLYDVPEGGHRPVTLIFAKDRSQEAIKEALFERRTAVWFDNILIGREAMLLPLLNSCAKILNQAMYKWDTNVLEVEIHNTSDAELVLYNKTAYSFHERDNLIALEPNSKTVLQVKTVERLAEVELKFDVLNAIIAPDTHPELVLEVKIEEN